MVTRTSRRQLFSLVAGASIATTLVSLPVPPMNRAIAQTPSDGPTLVCNEGNVNIRAVPGLGSKVVGLLQAGDTVTYYDAPADVEGLVWLSIRSSGPDAVAGWVAAEFLDTQSDVEGWDIGTRVRVDADYLNLRQAPGMDSIVTLIVPRDSPAITRAAPVEVDGAIWYGVILSYPDGTGSGYFAGEFLVEDDEQRHPLAATTTVATPVAGAATPVAGGATPVAMASPAAPTPTVLKPNEADDDPSIKPVG